MNEEQNLPLIPNKTSKNVLALIVNKEGQSTKAEELIQSLDNSGLSKLEQGIFLRALSNIIDEAKSKVKKEEFDEAEKYEKQFTLMGVKCERTQHTTYKFSEDPIRDRLLQQSLDLSNKIKEREMELKFMKTLTTQIDEETGEEFQPNPAIPYITDVLRITFPKKTEIK